MENSFVNNEIGLISHSTSAAPFSSPLSLPPSRCGDNPPKLCLGRFDSRNAMPPRRNSYPNKEKVLRDDNDSFADVFMTYAPDSDNGP